MRPSDERPDGNRNRCRDYRLTDVLPSWEEIICAPFELNFVLTFRRGIRAD
jgi:hypothetical protein